MGGTLAAIEGGFQQRQIQESAYRVQAAIERGDQVVVGVNKYRDDAAAARRRRRSRRSTPKGSGARSSASGACGRSATPPRGRRACGRLEDGARGDENLLPALIEAVEAYATVGEISDRLRAAWGEHRELITV